MDTVLISECKITAFFCILQIFSDIFFISHVFFCFFRLSKGGRTCIRKNVYGHFAVVFRVRKKAYELSTAIIRTFDCYHTNFRLLSYELLTATIRTFDCYHTNFRLLPYDHDLLSPRQQPRAFGGTTLTVLNHEQERLGLRHTTTGIRQPAIASRQTPRHQ